MPGLMDTLFGSSGEQGSTYNKGQLSLIDQIIQQIRGGQGGPSQDIMQSEGYSQGQDWLNSLFNDPEFFKNMEAPAFRQFNEEILPGVANRFASMGSGGATNSTAFRNALGRESSNLATNLAANRTGMQQQGINQQLGYAQQPVQNWMSQLQQALQPTNNTYQPSSGGLFGPAVGALAGGLGAGYGQQMGQRFAGQSPSTY